MPRGVGTVAYFNRICSSDRYVLTRFPLFPFNVMSTLGTLGGALVACHRDDVEFFEFFPFPFLSTGMTWS